MSKLSKGMPRIALVTHSLASGGGTARLTSFLYHILHESKRYSPEVVSLATSASDKASVLLHDPQSWRAGIRVLAGEWDGLPYQHVGAYLAEIEFQRYRPRQALRSILSKYDLVQFLTGTPPWANTARGITRPVLLWTATTVWADRASRIRNMPSSRRWWALLMTRLAQYYERRAVHDATHVFALSDYTQRSLQGWRPSASMNIAFCGIDTDLFCPSSKQASNYILCVGRLSDPRKNIHMLLNAYAQLVQCMETLPDLYLVGEMPSKGTLQVIHALGLLGRVHVLGPKTDQELAQVYQGAQFFVLSSDEEGLGLVILEAMSSGLAVISTRCGGPESAIVTGKTGYMTPPGDSKAMALAMKDLIDNPQLRETMGKTGRQVVEERFSYATAGKVFLDKYDQLLESRK